MSDPYYPRTPGGKENVILSYRNILRRGKVCDLILVRILGVCDVIYLLADFERAGGSSGGSGDPGGRGGSGGGGQSNYAKVYRHDEHSFSTVPLGEVITEQPNSVMQSFGSQISTGVQNAFGRPPPLPPMMSPQLNAGKGMLKLRVFING